MQTALLLDAVSFYVIALILLTAGPLPRAEPEAGRMRDRVSAGIAYIREKTALRRLLIAQGAAFIFFAAVIPVEVIYAKETLGAGDSGYGLMLASWGVGMVLGSLVFAVAAPRARCRCCSSSAPSRSAPATSASPRRRPWPRPAPPRCSAAPATGCSGCRRSAPCRR